MLAALCLAGCATYFPVNRPLSPEALKAGTGYRALRVDQDDSDELILVLAFSGGGTRAAAFAYGVLEELAATEVRFDGRSRALIDEVDSLSGVSGGSFTAAYFALHGRGIFDDFEQRFLQRDIQTALLARLLLWPPNWLRLFSPYWARSDLAAEYYDRVLFDGATYGDLQRRRAPFLQIHATDLTTGSPFAFIQEQFDYLCSELSSYPISRAVAASSAVPIVLSPITLRNYDGCGFEPPEAVRAAAERRHGLTRSYLNARNLLSYRERRRRFVRLIDGVASDNLGVRGPFEAFSTGPPRGSVRAPGNRVREVVLVIANAQTAPDAEWDRSDLLPSIAQIVDAATSAQVNRYNFETVELLRQTFARWNEVTHGWDPPLHHELIEVGFLGVPDEAERRYLNGLSTNFSLSDEATRRTRRAARTALRASPGFARLRRALGALGTTGTGDEAQPSQAGPGEPAAGAAAVPPAPAKQPTAGGTAE